MSTIERLAALFERFPGIGPRQAMRFVMFLLRASPSLRKEIGEALLSLGAHVHRCTECIRFHDNAQPLCSVCADASREPTLMLVAHDTDIAVLERSDSYHGRYFVLGGLRTLGTTKPAPNEAALLRRLKTGTIKELVLALPANPEGDMTAHYIKERILEQVPDTRITALGRGLSTGTEIEYADPATIKSAFENRR